MRNRIYTCLFFVFAFFYNQELFAQQGDYLSAEVGMGLGAAHYFGDLNTSTKLNRPKPAATLFFRKYLGRYIAARVGFSFAQLGYSDIYNKNNAVQLRRNLSFNTNVWEVSAQGDFHFFKFLPQERGLNFTPYITLGAGLFSYDPYAYLNNERYYFRELPVGTEGQNSPLYPDRKMYGTTALSIPFGGGFKYSIAGGRLNLSFEVLHRFTNTDYLDDVSTTYIDPSTYKNNGFEGTQYFDALEMNNREITKFSVPGSKRGNPSNKDSYFSFNLKVGISLNSLMGGGYSY